MKRVLMRLIFLCPMVLFCFESVKACSCTGGANPCSFFQANGGVAFIGTVTNIVEANEKYGKPIQGKVRKITIKVGEIFKGSVPSEVITSDDGFQCDNYPFSLGGTYLIYSGGILENTENILPVGLCSGTTPIQNAKESINFLRQMKNGVVPSILYGKVLKAVNGEKENYLPLPKTKVILTKEIAVENGQYRKPSDADKNITTLTNENGEYKFENLPYGRYKINSNLSEDLWIPEYRNFWAGGQPFCQNLSLTAFTNGSISGQIFNADGSVASFLKLNIYPLSPTARTFYGEGQTDEKGNYTFNGLPEGEYKIRVPLSWYSLDRSRSHPFEGFIYSDYFYPNSYEDRNAQIIKLGNIEKLKNVNFKMPTVPTKKTVSGIIVWEDGKPVSKGVVYYKLKSGDVHSRLYAYAKEDGTFSFDIYEGFDYEIFAENNSRENHGVSEWLSLKTNDFNKLILKPRN